MSRNTALTDRLSAITPGKVYRSCPLNDFPDADRHIRCIFCDAEAFHGDWVSWGEIRSLWQDVPIVVLCNEINVECAKKILYQGAWDCVPEPRGADEFELILNKISHYRQYVVNQQDLLASLIVSEQESSQKTTVMETMLDILSHDTRNVFLKLRSLIIQLPNSDLRGMILDSYEELYNGTQEALGYLKESKRVYSLPDLVSSLRLTENRVELKNHPHIRLASDSRILLYVEVSALFKNVLMNIIENALKYSGSGQDVDVTIRKFPKGHEIRIADRGPGIPDTFKQKIFDRYFRIDEHDGKGSGRGLWISRNIIEKEGGTIAVEDNPDGGTVFRIFIPMYRVDSLSESLARFSQWFQMPLSAIEQKAETFKVLVELQGFDLPEDEKDSIIVANVLDTLRKQKSSQGTKDIRLKLETLMQRNPDGPGVIIADDSLHVHYYLGQYLTELGYRVVKFAKNGAEALEYITGFDTDLVTLDCTMPGKSGIEVAKEAKARGVAAKTLFITALGDHPDFIEQLRRELPEGSYGIITKPFTKLQLISALKALGCAWSV